MPSIKTLAFPQAQKELSLFLSKKLMGETMNEALTKRAQKLADKWFKEIKMPILIEEAGIRITGAVLAFGLGSIRVAKWKTQFMRDQYELTKVVPDHIALGYVNGNQLYIADVDGTPHLCARNTPSNVERWSVAMEYIPPQTSVLFVALERARMLGYLDHLKGIK